MITKVQYRTVQIAKTSSQGLMDKGLAEMLRHGWRIEAILSHGSAEWTALMRRRTWFWN